MACDTHQEQFADALAAARHALAPGGWPSARRHSVASWEWDLATGRMIWDAGLGSLFGYAEVATNAAWREERIHPDDRDRVKLSLERATIVNHGSVWSETYAFRRADGSYVTVAERACIVPDGEGPCRVLGALNLEA